MSFKVYNGVKFRSDMSLEEVVRFVQSIKPALQKNYEQEVFENCLKETVLAFDRITLANMGWADTAKFTNQSALSEALRIVSMEHKTSEKEGVSSGNMEFVLFLTDQGILGIPYLSACQEKFLISHYVNKGVMEEYSYFDNSDKPSSLSDAKWQERKKAWHSVFQESSISTECGVSVKLSKQYAFQLALSEFDSFFQHMPDQDKHECLTPIQSEPHLSARAKRLASSVDNNSWEKPFPSLGQAMSYYMKIENDGVPEFLEARKFFSEHVLEERLTQALLSSNQEQLKDYFDQKRRLIYTKDIPVSLHTPGFEQTWLNDSLAPSASLSAKRKM